MLSSLPTSMNPSSEFPTRKHDQPPSLPSSYKIKLSLYSNSGNGHNRNENDDDDKDAIPTFSSSLPTSNVSDY